MLALVYCNFLKDVRIDGWGTEGPKALTLGQYVRVCVCATILLGSGDIMLGLKVYTFF